VNPLNPKILIDSCSYNCQNVGDLAMLTVAVSRLRELWPAASIRIITNAPDLIARHCGRFGDVTPVPVAGRRRLLGESLLGRVAKQLPESIAAPWQRAEDGWRMTTPHLFATSLNMKARVRGTDVSDVDAFLGAVRDADLVVVNGAGILTDAFRDNAMGILATLDLAIHRKIPTAMFGQGLGPIDGAELRQRAADVLPCVDLIGVRESRSSVPLLRSLGVSPSRIVVTGDDAIEMAYADGVRQGREARAIGVNVRIAPYSNVGRDLLTSIRHALEQAARSHEARLIPLPIAHHGGGMDIETLRELLPVASSGDDPGAALDTPQDVIEQTGECRVVVTGSYHGAVFALAQGIPVVALARSRYYVDKMAGVMEQFGVGCELLALEEHEDRARLVTRLRTAIDRAWADADRVRAPLLASARDQIARGRQAYARCRLLLGDTVERLESPQVDFAVNQRG
jgi:polysaccharide pyruvyl transferase WcaK-like protein